MTDRKDEYHSISSITMRRTLFRRHERYICIEDNQCYLSTCFWKYSLSTANLSFPVVPNPTTAFTLSKLHFWCWMDHALAAREAFWVNISLTTRMRGGVVCVDTTTLVSFKVAIQVAMATYMFIVVVRVLPATFSFSC